MTPYKTPYSYIFKPEIFYILETSKPLRTFMNDIFTENQFLHLKQYQNTEQSTM